MKQNQGGLSNAIDSFGLEDAHADRFKSVISGSLKHRKYVYYAYNVYCV